MKYLIVVAHPDDEVLGAGASIWKWTHTGDIVDVCIMSTEAKARAFRPEDKELDDDLNASAFPSLIQISYLLENQRGFSKRGDSPTTFPQQFQLL